MRKWCVLGLALALASSASALPNVANATQKGSLLIFPDIRIDVEGGLQWNTLVRIQNDGTSNIDVLCYWMDGNKNKVDFIVTVTKNQPIWFDAATGRGTRQLNRFPSSLSNGFEDWNGFPNGNPFLGAPPGPGVGLYRKGMLACWAVDDGAMNQVKWNHLSGTATVYHPALGMYEYNAYGFFVARGLDKQPVGTAGSLPLNGVDYDQCPVFQLGQFTPTSAVIPASAPNVLNNRLAITGCTLNLNQDWTPVFTGLTFDVWNEDGTEYTGAFECADSWHETDFTTNFDSGAQGFLASVYASRYRLQAVAIRSCNRVARVVDGRVVEAAITTVPVGIISVQSTRLGAPLTRLGRGAVDYVGTTLASAGKMDGRVMWDPEDAVPEGRIR